MKYISKYSIIIASFIIISCKNNRDKGPDNGQQVDDYTAKIDSLIQTANPRKFNGVILITQNGETKYSRAYGYSDFDSKEPISIKDNFRIQSNSKQITAVIILKEVESGKIDLNSPIKAYLPEIKQTWADTVTVHQLLNMSSGIVAIDKPLIFKPGTGFHYSNPAYWLLGKIIQNVTGKKFTEVANNLFEELQMNDTYCYEIGKNHNRLVNGYEIDEDNFKLLEFSSFGFTKEQWIDFIPAGGIISNVQDLNIWDVNLHNGKILKPETYKSMTSSDVPDIHKAFSDEKITYGYGINFSDNTAIKYIGHAGRGMGFSSLKLYVPAKRVDVIVLENVYNSNESIIYYFEKKIREIVMESSLMGE
ncbi:MAG: serine hydrolase domain-containing protein [Pricia sp.]